MSLQRGSQRSGVNSGITLPGVAGVINCDTFVWSFSVDVPDKPRFGRDSGGVMGYRPLFLSTAGSIKAKFPIGGSPAPDSFIGVRTTLVHKVHLAKTVSIPIEITGYGPSYDVNKDDAPWLMLNWRATGAPVFDGWDDPAEVAALTKSDQQQYGGTQIGYDPKGLNPPQTVLTIDWWGDDVADTNAGEQAKLIEVMAAAIVPGTLPHEYKQRGGVIMRDASDGGTAQIYYGLTDNEEDWINARTSTTTDPDGLATSATTAAINSTPATPSGMVSRGVTSAEINDSKIGYVKESGLRSREQDVEFPGTVTSDDQSDLADEKTITLVQESVTPSSPPLPSGYKLVSIQTEQLTDVTTTSKFRHVFLYRRRNNQESVEMDGSQLVDDASDISDSQTITLVQSSSVASATPPSTPSGLKLVDKISVQIHDATTGAKWRNTYRYGRQNREDEIKMGGSSISDCASDIADGQIIVLIKSSSTPDAPSTPTGLKLRETIIGQIHDASGNEKWRHEYRYARTNREDDIEFGDTATIFDAEALESGGTIAVINTSATPPGTPAAPATDTKLISTTTKQIHGAATPKYVHIFKYGVRTTQEDIEWLKSASTAEAAAVKQEEIVVRVTTSATPDATGLNPDSTNLSLYWSQSHRVTDTQYVHLFAFRPFTVEEEMEEGDSFTSADAVAALVGEARRAILDTNSSAPSAPSVSGRTCIRSTTRRVGKLKYLHIYEYDFRDNASKLEAAKTRTTTDSSALESTAVTADVWLVSGGAPSTPTLSGFVLRDTTDFEIENALYRLRVYEWGLTTRAQDREQQVTNAEVAVVELYKRRTGTIISSTDTVAVIADGLLTTNQSSSTFSGATVTRANLPPDKALQIIDYISEDKIIHSSSNHVVRERVNGLPASALTGSTIDPGAVVFGDSNAKVLILVPGPPLSGLSTYTSAKAMPVFIWRALSRFTLRRVYTTSDMTTKQYLALKGKVNFGTFMGHATGEVMYLGPSFVFSFSLAGVRRLVVDYDFATDRFKFFGDGFLPSGLTYVNDIVGFSLQSSGFYTSTKFDAGYVCDWPGSTDFSGFLT